MTEWLEHWDEHGFGYQVVELTAPPTLVIGFTGVRHRTWTDVPVLNLYYRYAADHHGHGYATEGARQVVTWAAQHHPATPVLAYTTLDNIGSQRTAEGAGLRRRPQLEHMLRGRWSVVLTSTWPTAAP